MKLILSTLFFIANLLWSCSERKTCLSLGVMKDVTTWNFSVLTQWVMVSQAQQP